MFKRLKEKIEFKLIKKKWREKNKHNKIELLNKCNIDNISVGKYSYGGLIVYEWGSYGEGLEIGNYVSIASGVKFILGGNHKYKNFSTYPFNTMFCNGEVKNEVTSNGKIVIQDDVWIGLEAIILSGVTIGKGAVIGAGSVVSKDIPPYAIAVGNPVKIIKYRFEDEIIKNQLKYDMCNLSHSYIKKNIDLLYKEINMDNLNNIINV